MLDSRNHRVSILDKSGAYYSEKYQIDVYNSDGKLTFRFGWNFRPIKNKKYKKGSALPEYFPAFARKILFDDEGNLWLRQYGNNEKNILYDVFSPDGIYLKQIIVPHRISLLKGEKAYCIVQTEEEFVVKRFKITMVDFWHEKY